MENYPIVIGDSHAVFMAQAFGDLNVPDAWSYDDFEPIKIMQGADVKAEFFPILNSKKSFFNFYDNKIFINENFNEIITKRKSNWSYCLISLEGNQHNANFMIQGDKPFDFFDPNYPSIFIKDYQIIPREFIIKFFKRSLITLGIKLQLITAALPNMKIYFAAPPPPIPSNDHILKFPEIFNFNGLEINNEFVRLKIYFAYVEVINEYCKSQGIEILLPTNDCIDEIGFLKSDLWNYCTHAQPNYYKNITSLII